jgi:hypothetical protein
MQRVYFIQARMNCPGLCSETFDVTIQVLADCEENARRNAISDTLNLNGVITKIYSCELACDV